ncbi:MAG: aminotransferase class III-fold pyridoxal phosphate-dependent enzyme, partial [Acidobacteriota bacterium]
MLPSREEVAVIGMAGRLPGARSIDELWRNLTRGVESIRSFSREELVEAGVDPAVLGDPDYVNAGAVLDDADMFAASFFGYSPRDAELTDPQQRVFLECAWEALESAGYDAARCPGVVSVFAGIALNSYFQNNLMTRPELRPLLGQFQMTLGNEKDFLATRVAYKLNLRGPSLTVQTGCSTSLVATHLACQALLGGECDIAIVGGGRIRVPLSGGYRYVEGGVPSPDGHCRAFDARADGCVAGSGMAAVVLKRLSDAIRDGDLVHAVIRGSAINNDGGDKIGFTAPSVSGQAAVITQALAMADVSADSIGYLEAHGTGTALGDPIEIAALTQAYREHTARRGYCLIGSIKTNIGHLDAGAGVAGLIKAVLAVKHGEIPPSLHFERPNPHIDFAGSPFAVAAQLTLWDNGGRPRRAGVSSFGIGGTNAHLIVEQAPARAASPGSVLPQLLVVSAKTAAALDQASANLTAALRDAHEVNLADVAHTLQAGRSAFGHRRVVVARDAGEAARLLAAGDPQRVFSGVASGVAPSVVFLFPGGGAQYVEMGRELYERLPEYRTSIDRSCEAAQTILGMNLRCVLFPDERCRPQAGQMLEQPRLALAALFATELAVAQLLIALGIRPAAMLGHSMGEYVAACVAGVFTQEQGLALVAKRGELFETLADGAMLSVPLSEAELTPLLGSDVSIGAVNAPALCMASGPAAAIANLERRLADSGIDAQRIHIAVAAHSAMLDPILPEFDRFCRSVPLARPQLPFVSNLTGTWITGAQATDPAYWVQHLRQTVRFADGMNTLLSEPGRVFVETGPGRTLSGLARQQDVKTQQAWATIKHVKDADSDLATLLQGIGRLWLAGVPVNWERIHDGPRRRVSLPTYPFERTRHWIEPIVRAETGVVAAAPVVTAALEPIGRRIERRIEHSVETPRDASASRTQRLTQALKELLHDLSGVDIRALDERATFLELGFESLFLTQANAAVQRQFKVRTTFRQWFEQTPTISALAAFLDQKLPPDVPGAPAPDARPTEGPVAAPHGVEPLPATASAIGPWKPIDGRSSTGLTTGQLDHVRALIERYCRKTAGSKRMSEEQRTRLADPRSGANFRQIWKEMVYQIAVTHSRGSRLWDIDGNEFIDVTMGFSVNLFGFSPDFVTKAIARQLECGIEIGVLAPATRDVANAICEMTGVDRVCFVNTGSEANMAAIRAARTVTGRERIAVFAGAYHGISDEVLVKSIRANGQPRSVPVAPGIPPSMFTHVTVLDYGDAAAIEFLRCEGHDFAAVLVEPIQTRHPDLQPREFLHALRAVTEETGTALVFDEVVTGF